MRRDVLELRAFYATPLGRAVRAMVMRQLVSAWGDASGLDVLGLGYPTPFLDPFRSKARRVVAGMPAGQGVETWPAHAANLACLTAEDALPFPGALFDRALGEAGLDRGAAWVTNAVKHFKHEARGKRRLHKTPDAGEITACRWWLDQERALIRPRVILALGGSAALSVFGRPMPILKSRGVVFDLDDGARAMITVHPSYLLRLPDPAAKAEAYDAFVRDLAAARALLD